MNENLLDSWNDFEMPLWICWGHNLTFLSSQKRFLVAFGRVIHSWKPASSPPAKSLDLNGHNFNIRKEVN